MFEQVPILASVVMTTRRHLSEAADAEKMVVGRDESTIDGGRMGRGMGVGVGRTSGDGWGHRAKRER